jgi:ATP-dependent helicase IRC3
MIGRGLRLHAGKKNCHVIDMVSSLETGIVTTPTLFGLDPGEVVQNASASDLQSLKERKEAEELREAEIYTTANGRAGPSLSASTKVTFTQYSSVLDLIADTSGEKHIRSISQHAWVQVGEDRYVLCAPSGSFIRIERLSDKVLPEPIFRAVEVRALPQGVAKSPYAAPKELLKAVNFVDAVHGSDNYATSNYPRAFIHRYQRWRQEPPTDGQLKFINKLRGNKEPLAADEITKGKAMDMITKIRHGARGRFADMMAENRRKERQVVRMENETTRKRREHVSVGPILH